ncbi:MAG: carboxypeptidase-like regulatory domain-containing protein [Aestuariibaculum sp.]
MAKHYISILIVLLGIGSQAQKQIGARLLDASTKKAIPFATVSLNNKLGVISNEHGFFQLHINTKMTTTDSLFFSCLGYENKSKLALTFADSIVYLSPKSIELDEVLVSNKHYTAEEIIYKIKENIKRNYPVTLNKSTVFYRDSYYNNIDNVSVELEKSTIPEINQNLIDSLLYAMPKQGADHTEILAHFYTTNLNENNEKMDIIKAAKLFNNISDMTFENIEKRLNTILRTRIKRDSYFKIKSGVFGTKTEIDSSFFEENTKPEDIEKTEAYLKEQQEKEQKQKDGFLKWRKHTISQFSKKTFYNEDSHLNFIFKHKKYDFELLDHLYLNNNFVYKIAFTPKRNAKYQGVFYVNLDDFAIVRVDYQNTENIRNFKLLGVSYRVNGHKGCLIYEKNTTSSVYNLKYAEEEELAMFGFNRPIKIIEKNKHTKGRRKQNEIDTDIDFIMNSRTRKELVVFENVSLTTQEFDTFKENANVTPTKLPKYDPNFWKGYNIIEPNEAIKNFKAIETE